MRDALALLRQISASRGLDRRTGAGLAASLALAVISAHLSVSLRTPADLNMTSPVLDSGILVGLAVPTALISRLTQDRMAWAQHTGARSRLILRTAWVAVLLAFALVLGGAGALLVPGQQFPLLLLADGVTLTCLGIIGSVVLGGTLGWLVPMAVALVCSTPGVIPIGANWLAVADRGAQMMGVAVVTAIAASLLFVAFDDYGLARQTRLLQRVPGVVDD